MDFLQSLLSRRQIIRFLAGVSAWFTARPTLLRAQERRPAARREPLVIPKVARDQVICFCLYTLHRRVLKLSAQLYPLEEGEERTVHLEIERDPGKWERVVSREVNPEGMIATFRVENWDEARAWNYRVTHRSGADYRGIIRQDPKNQDEIVVGNLSCNGNNDRGPRADLVANLKAQNPDLLFFAGDQSYDHREHYAAWLLFGRQFGELIKDRPTVTIPDDHDVGHPNLWGAGGRQSRRNDGADGGYMMPVAYVNEVQRAQCSHLPDPFDATPIARGISVYYTSLNVGGIDFAILEDRKWKTGPFGVIPPMGPRPDHINDPAYDRASIDVPEAELLGARQLKFLREWGQRWEGVVMKCALSQTIFCGGAHLHGKRDNRLLADLDSNGWPQSGRNAALREIRRCFALMLGGDQHLATIIHHGVNEWEDAGISLCSPSIANIYPRWWMPLEKPFAHDPANPLEHSGRYHDGFGNKVTMHAYANPSDEHPFATGYTLVRFKKSTREIQMECWPRGVDVTQPSARQFRGWPRTVKQEDNYARRAVAWLPTLQITGPPDPLVQVLAEDDGEIVYTVRIQGNRFRPKVFKAGVYTVKVGEGAKQQVLTEIASLAAGDEEAIREITM